MLYAFNYAMYSFRYPTDARNMQAAAAPIYGRTEFEYDETLETTGGRRSYNDKRSHVTIQIRNLEALPAAATKAEVWIQPIQVDDQYNAVRLNGEYQAHPNRLVIKGGIENKDTMGNVTVLSDGETCGKSISLSRI